MWRYTGQQRPDFAEIPGPGQESVWDYPRPPQLVPDSRRVEVHHGEVLLAASERCLRLCETASPPTFYIPPADVAWDAWVAMPGQSFCEWKGIARYWGLQAAPELGAIAWSYPQPSPAYTALKDHLSVYPSRLTCTVDGERVRPQPGGFYGGWVTDEIVGPFKGGPGTSHW